MQIKKITVGPILTNCYLLLSGGETALIDPGADPEAIIRGVKSLGGELKFIVNTHYHYDHTLANRDIKMAFPAAELLIHEKEKGKIKFRPDRFLKTGEEISIGNINLKILNTPGHSSGSICLLGPGFIFTGDTLFKDGYGRTDLPTGNEAEMAESLEKLKEIIKPGMAVYPGHGESYIA